MKILFVISHFNFWAPLDPIALDYVAQGHEVHVLIDRARNFNFEKRYPFGPGTQPYKMDWSLSRGDAWQFILNPLRELISYVAYLKLRKSTSPLLTERWAAYVPFFLKPFTRTAAGREWLSRESFWRFIRRLESRAPTARRLKRQLSELKPDVLIAASAILPYSKETDYIKAGQEAGVPTVLVIPSWDNLTTKGMLHVIPDHVFVWNKGQISEAEELHNIPAENVFYTGAPKFDTWFDIKPSLDRRTFCEKIGIDPEKPYLLYLCWSEFISGDEAAYIAELADRIKKEISLENLTLLVRPHPQNLKPWKSYDKNISDFSIWPVNQKSLAPSDMIQDYYHSLYYSIGVAGINTSAFIEAAIVDKPCIAITPERYAYTQMGIPHFHHLLDAGFLELSPNMDEFLLVISHLLAGEDRNKVERRQFVKNFVRPHGVDIPALQVLSHAVKNVAVRRQPDFELEILKEQSN
jgi:hypothetical protein